MLSELPRLIREDPGYLNMTLYLFYATAAINTIAEYESFFGVRVPHTLRMICLIWNREQLEKISILCVMSQIFTYIMVVIFVISRFLNSFDFLSFLSQNPVGLLNKLIKVHNLAFLPGALIEVGICALVKRWKNR